MGFTITRCLLVAAIAFSNFAVTSACSCFRSNVHLQDLYCDAKYVLEIVVTGDEIIETSGPFGLGLGERRYTINTTRVYKRSPEYDGLSSKNHIFTATNSAACGVFLEVGKKYVILGSPRGGRLSVHLCQPGLLRVDRITHEQQCNLEYGFAPNCDKCKIKYCDKPNEPCDQQQLNLQTCVFDQVYPESQCIHDFAHCKSVAYKCVWSDGGSGKLDTCLNGQA